MQPMEVFSFLPSTVYFSCSSCCYWKWLWFDWVLLAELSVLVSSALPWLWYGLISLTQNMLASESWFLVLCVRFVLENICGALVLPFFQWNIVCCCVQNHRSSFIFILSSTFNFFYLFVCFCLKLGPEGPPVYYLNSCITHHWMSLIMHRYNIY